MARVTRQLPSLQSIAHALSDLPNSRRGLLRALERGGEASEGACSRACGPCKRGKAGRCRPKPDGTACPAGGVCKHGRCVCTGATPAHCGDVYGDLASDPDNCGACGRFCATDEGCDAASRWERPARQAPSAAAAALSAATVDAAISRPTLRTAASVNSGRAATSPSARTAAASVPAARPARRAVSSVAVRWAPGRRAAAANSRTAMAPARRRLRRPLLPGVL